MPCISVMNSESFLRTYSPWCGMILGRLFSVTKCNVCENSSNQYLNQNSTINCYNRNLPTAVSFYTGPLNINNNQSPPNNAFSPQATPLTLEKLFQYPQESPVNGNRREISYNSKLSNISQ